MAQLHTFSNPFFKNLTSDKENNPFAPYQTLIGSAFKSTPWQTNSHLAHNWYELQQKFWQEYWELATWQQQSMQQNMKESAQMMMHCMQLSMQPNKLYRYLRKNWQKPYMAMGAQAMSSTRLYSRLMSDSWNTWQQMMVSGEQHKH